MIIRIEDIQEVCSKLLYAVDSNGLSMVTETLEIKTEDKNLELSVTNREYVVTIKIPIFTTEAFHATVNANVFLKLMSQITTETVEFTVENNALVIKGNGTYNLPMIYEGTELLEIPKIEIANVTSSFDIPTGTLNSILNYNSKELNKGVFSKPVQKMYYIDEKGCITFTTGACVNNFTLDKPIKILLNSKIVKLFKLFTSDSVAFSLGHDSNGGVTQTKVCFKSDKVSLNAIITSDDTMINSVPVDAIRDRATDAYPNSVVLNKVALLDAINRLLLFTNTKDIIKSYSKFVFTSAGVTMYDRKEDNMEVLKYENNVTMANPYELVVDLIDIKLVLESCKDEFITMNFGNSQAIVIQRPNVYNVIPECAI